MHGAAPSARATAISRCEHVLLGEMPQVVDCIEFDRGLRALDVAADLAFLVMDLVASGGARFARALLQAYREAGGDPGENQLIAFYASYRALVRAKVALLRAAQHPAGSSAHGHESADARELLRLAEQFAWRARLPLAIVICGAPAAGKSQLAGALAELSRLPHLSSDVTRKRLGGIHPRQRAADAAYSAEFNRLTYSELGRRARSATAACGGVIVDATFRHRADRQAFAEAFRRRRTRAVRRVPRACARAGRAGGATRAAARAHLGRVPVGGPARELRL